MGACTGCDRVHAGPGGAEQHEAERLRQRGHPDPGTHLTHPVCDHLAGQQSPTWRYILSWNHGHVIDSLGCQLVSHARRSQGGQQAVPLPQKDGRHTAAGQLALPMLAPNSTTVPVLLRCVHISTFHCWACKL